MNLRLLIFSALFWSLFPWGEKDAHAQNQPDQAEALNQEGKALFKEEKFFEASKKFRRAIEINPSSRYYFNLCFALNILERYQDALVQCEQVRNHNPDPKLTQKTDGLIFELRKRVPASQQPLPPNNGNGGFQPPSNPNPNTGGNPGVGTNVSSGFQPPPGPAFVQQNANRDYKWSLGAELGYLRNLGLGENILGKNFGDGLQLKVVSNFLFSSSSRFGSRGFLNIAALTASDTNVISDEPLTIIDLGGGLFYDIPIIRNLVVTPFAGVHVGFLQPDGDAGDVLLAVGYRFEATVSFLLGDRGQHAITLTPTYAAYTGAQDEFTAAEFGLDNGGDTFSFNVGYTIRFDTPFGANPILNLE